MEVRHVKIGNLLRFDEETAQILTSLAARIDQFKGKWSGLETDANRYLRKLKQIATIQSIGSSTRIEGVALSDAEIEMLLKDLTITQFKTRDEQEVVGYYETLELILDRYMDIELSESNIKTLHNQLLKHSTKDEPHRGGYKQFSNQVVATYRDGTQKTIFKTSEPLTTPMEMQDIVEWTTARLGDEDFHNLFAIGTFIYEFLSIHPFQDGNGRLSRLLTTLLLMRYGYDFIQYVSFENSIEESKTEYYRALMTSQKHRGSKNEVISKWMLFFFRSIEALTKKLDSKYERYLQVGRLLNQRQQELIEYVRNNGVVQIGDVSEKFSTVSKSTLKRDLQLLQSEMLLRKTGRGKSTAYHATD